MHSTGFSFTLLSLLLLVIPAQAVTSVSVGADSSAVTIYRATEDSAFDFSEQDAIAYGIGMVTETRTLDLVEGEQVVQFQSVAQTIVPQSALIENLPDSIMEVNFNYNLLAPSSLFQHYIGQTVRVIKTHKKTGVSSEAEAQLLSGNNGYLLQYADHIEPLNCSGEHEKLIFPALPSALNPTPILSAKLRVAKSGTYTLRLSYLATGFDWVANYVAMANPVTNKLQLTGWLTLINQQDMSFINADVDVIAGNVSRDESTEPIPTEVEPFNESCWFRPNQGYAKKALRRLASVGMPAAAYMSSDLEEIVVSGVRAVAAEARELGDYKLYHLPFKTDVTAHQMKQVQLFSKGDVNYEKHYTFTFDEDNFSKPLDHSKPINFSDTLMFNPDISLRLINKKSEGLGLALPAGGISVFESGGLGSGQILVGTDRLRDTPVNLPVDLTLGVADKVDVQVITLKEIDTSSSDKVDEAAEVEFVVTNNSTEDINIEIKPNSQFYDENVRFTRASSRSAMKDGVPVWRLTLASGKQKKLTMTIEHLAN